MICMDNSEHMRNGDYSPNRLQAQSESVHHIADAKLQANPEAIVGCLTMAGRRIDVLNSPSRSIGEIMQALDKRVRIGGTLNLCGGLKTAQLALKNRQNPNQKPRVIAFVGSPVTNTPKEFKQLAKDLKQNGVAVDIINFGTENNENKNKEILEDFIKRVNKGDNSHYLHIEPGPHVLSDLVLSSLLTGSVSAGGAGGGFGMMDDGMDSELEMVMRLSREAERVRQEEILRERIAASAAEAGVVPQTPVTPANPAAAAAASAAAMEDEEEEDEDDEELMAAIALSMSLNQPEAAAEPATEPATESATEAAAEPAAEEVAGDDVADALNDPEWLDSFLGDVGVSKEELGLDNLLDSLTADPVAAAAEEEAEEQKSKKQKTEK